METLPLNEPLSVAPLTSEDENTLEALFSNKKNLHKQKLATESPTTIPPQPITTKATSEDDNLCSSPDGPPSPLTIRNLRYMTTNTRDTLQLDTRKHARSPTAAKLQGLSRAPPRIHLCKKSIIKSGTSTQLYPGNLDAPQDVFTMASTNESQSENMLRSDITPSEYPPPWHPVTSAEDINEMQNLAMYETTKAERPKDGKEDYNWITLRHDLEKFIAHGLCPSCLLEGANPARAEHRRSYPGLATGCSLQ
ncbi:uncharacterized protein EI90DRAFT_3072915, partial [Cantharellus anzutake]|uniref:uncharacterized protein n=1 Tax=Cantharellus anzutake TaxID=1750568 RepID=UPI001906FE1F